MNDQLVDTGGPRRGRNSARRKYVLLTAVAVGIGLLVWGYCYFTPDRSERSESENETPSVDLSSLDPAVAKALRDGAAAVGQSPESGDAWGELGMTFLAHDFPTEASRCLSNAERLDGDQPRWPYLQGRIAANDDPRQAIEKLRRAVKLSDESSNTPLLCLAEVLLEEDLAEQAQRNFEEVLKRDPYNARAHLGLGRLNLVQGRLRESLRHLNKSLTHKSAQRSSRVLLAQVHHQLGHTTAAQHALELSDRLPPDQPWPDLHWSEMLKRRTGLKPQLSEAVMLLNAGQIDTAVDRLRDLSKTYPDSESVWTHLGRGLSRRREWTACEKALRMALRLNPDNVEAHFRLGVALALQRKHTAAVKCYREATRCKSDFVMAHYNLGHSLTYLQQTTEALNSFRAAVDCQPNFANGHMALGDLLAKQGRNGEALKHLSRAVQISPNNSWARTRLEQVRRQAKATMPDE